MDSASDKLSTAIPCGAAYILKAFDPERPIREADKRGRGRIVGYVSISDIAHGLKMKEAANGDGRFISVLWRRRHKHFLLQFSHTRQQLNAASG